jgi:5-methylcytosine-specific restriction endonuclease McrA
MAEPFPKSRQLARGERRYRRKVASPKQWQAIIAEKGSACRLYGGLPRGDVEYHHLVPRSQGGDDVAANIVPLCRGCHVAVTTRDSGALQSLVFNLTDSERAYIIGKLGEGGIERLFGVGK